MTEHILHPTLIADGRTLRISNLGANGGINLQFTPGEVRSSYGISVKPEELASALDGIVPGFKCSYVVPVELPGQLGTRVRGEHYTWIRARHDVVHAWWCEPVDPSRLGFWSPDEDVIEAIRQGAEIAVPS